MRRPIIVLDACVLYPAPLRDLLMHLALLDLFRARWTEAIHEEWISNILGNRPDLSRKQLERTRRLMNLHVRDCLVEGYEDLIEAVDLPDQNDRHVLAAAIKSGADMILTFNLKDFPRQKLEAHGIEAIHPDDLIVSLIKTDAEIVSLAAERQRSSLRSPPMSRNDFLRTLRRQDLSRTCEMLATLL